MGGGGVSLGAWMAQGVKLSPTQIDAIETAWIMTGNASFAAKVAQCSARTAQAHVQNNHARLCELRAQKSPTALDLMRLALNELVSGLLDPAKIRDARLGEVATATGILVDKIQLLSGEATVRTESRSINPDAVLTPEEREQAARIRAKLAGELVVSS